MPLHLTWPNKVHEGFQKISLVLKLYLLRLFWTNLQEIYFMKKTHSTILETHVFRRNNNALQPANILAPTSKWFAKCSGGTGRSCRFRQVELEIVTGSRPRSTFLFRSEGFVFHDVPCLRAQAPFMNCARPQEGFASGRCSSCDGSIHGVHNLSEAHL